jgi:uncharacterized membrane protein YeaQ/YmgE (transglycosylase-associated protein family)
MVTGNNKKEETNMENNTIGYWVWFLFIGGVIGWLAGLIIRGRGFGIIGDILVGIVGAMLGGWIAGVLGLYTSSSVGAFLVALAGAVILVGLTRFIVRRAAA